MRSFPKTGDKVTVHYTVRIEGLLCFWRCAVRARSIVPARQHALQSLHGMVVCENDLCVAAQLLGC